MNYMRSNIWGDIWVSTADVVSAGLKVWGVQTVFSAADQLVLVLVCVEGAV